MKIVTKRDEERIRGRAAVFSLLVGVFLMVAKFMAYHATSSQAVLSDALESIVNIIAASMALFAMRYAAQPTDQDHPYGHGKSEYFSAAFEGGLITFAAGFICVEAISSFFTKPPLQNLESGMLIVLGAGVGNLLLGLYLLHVGKKHKSLILRASGLHVISDFWTSIGVVLGLLAVKWTGYVWLDPTIALIVAAYLAFNGSKLVLESINGLMDKEDLTTLAHLSKVFTRYATEGIIQIHNVKVIRSGDYHHIDAHLVVPEFWKIDQVHENILKFEENVLESYGYGGELNYHLDPCRRVYCEVCDLKDCPIRAREFKKRMPVVLEHIRSPKEPLQFLDEKMESRESGD